MLTSCGYHSQGNAESPRDTEITPCGLVIAIMGNACVQCIFAKYHFFKAGEVHEQQFQVMPRHLEIGVCLWLTIIDNTWASLTEDLHSGQNHQGSTTQLGS